MQFRAMMMQKFREVIRQKNERQKNKLNIVIPIQITQFISQYMLFLMCFFSGIDLFLTVKLMNNIASVELFLLFYNLGGWDEVKVWSFLLENDQTY